MLSPQLGQNRAKKDNTGIIIIRLKVELQNFDPSATVRLATTSRRKGGYTRCIIVVVVIIVKPLEGISQLLSMFAPLESLENHLPNAIHERTRRKTNLEGPSLRTTFKRHRPRRRPCVYSRPRRGGRFGLRFKFRFGFIDIDIMRKRVKLFARLQTNVGMDDGESDIPPG